MKISYIQFNKENKYLTEVLPMIPTNTILNKTLTGLGATYGELKADRHSIIIEPNVPVIVGKIKDPKHKNSFGVYEGIYSDDVVEYLEKNKGYHKILTTPESFNKVKDAFFEVGINIYEESFLLFDECERIIQDVCYRQDIALPIDDFFRFENKAMVSATPLRFSDPRFEEQGFEILEIRPTYDYKRDFNLLVTNNILGALQKTIGFLEEQDKKICIFLNSTDTTDAIIKQLHIEKESSVFCSSKSVLKLNERKFNHAYDQWTAKRMKKYNFFTSRFYSAVDIELEDTVDLIMISDIFYAEHSMIDPNTEAPQIIGRFRNGVNRIFHITNLNENISIKAKDDIEMYLKCSEDIYSKIKIIENLESLIKGIRQILFKETTTWKSCKIGDILKIGSGKDYKHLKNGNTPVYGTGGYMLSVNDYLYDGESVCIGRKGTIDKPLFLNGKFWTVDTLFYTYNFQGLLPRFCYYLFNSINWLQYNEASGVPSLSKETIENIPIHLPNMCEQEKICSILDTINSKLEIENKALSAYQVQKKCILNKIFI